MTSEPQRLPIQISPREWGGVPVRIVNWLVERGEDVIAGDVLVEVGIPGILGDVRTPVDARVVEICHTEEELVTADTILGWLEPLGDGAHSEPLIEPES